MSQQIYPIQLLNELHNHFPELLYNHRRFQNVQDVLSYIRSVADMSPYQRGIQQYNTRPNRVPQPTTPPNPMTQSIPIPSVNSTIPQTFVTMFDEFTTTPAVPTTRVRMSMNNNALMNTLLGGLFGDIIAGNGLNMNNFLNERVLVYPTNEEISNASTTFRATSHQDDICAICQDEIEINQDVRRLTHCNHSFHQDCIDTWFRGNVHCPTCRHDIREINQQTNRNDNRNDRNQNTVPPPVPENYRRMNIRRPDNN